MTHDPGIAAQERARNRLGMRTRRTEIACALVLWTRESDHLHFPPWRPGFRECHPYRERKLNGRYRWRAYTVHWAHRNDPSWHQRFPRLRGRYRWFACRYHVAGKGYRIESDFTNLATGGRIWLEHAWYGGRYGDGRYEWGSSLDRVGRFRG